MASPQAPCSFQAGGGAQGSTDRVHLLKSMRCRRRVSAGLRPRAKVPGGSASHFWWFISTGPLESRHSPVREVWVPLQIKGVFSLTFAAPLALTLCRVSISGRKGGKKKPLPSFSFGLITICPMHIFPASDAFQNGCFLGEVFFLPWEMGIPRNHSR